jgi:hypothetical protein
LKEEFGPEQQAKENEERQKRKVKEEVFINRRKKVDRE